MNRPAKPRSKPSVNELSTAPIVKAINPNKYVVVEVSKAPLHEGVNTYTVFWPQEVVFDAIPLNMVSSKNTVRPKEFMMRRTFL